VIAARLRGRDELLGRLEEALQEAGGDGAQAFITVRQGEHTRFAGGRVHQPQAVEEVQMMVTVDRGGGAARVATSRLEDARATGAEALKRAAALAPGRSPAGGAAEALSGSFSHWHEDTAAWDAGARSQVASVAMALAQAAGATANGMLSKVLVEMATASPSGSAYVSATEAAATLLVRHGEGSAYRGDLARSVERMAVEEMVHAALAEAAAARDPEPLPPGTYDVVLGPLAVGDMLTFFGGLGFTGEAVAAGTGAVAGRKGQPVASPLITVADDALSDEVGLPIPFDIEGMPKVRVPMLDRGRVGEAVFDLATARAAGARTTGHAHIAREEAPSPTPANLILRPGSSSSAELIQGVDDGLYISRFHYTRMVDPEASTFTGVTRDAAFRIRGGRLAGPVASSRFTEEVLGILSRTDGVGSQLISQPIMNVWNGAASAPSLRVRGFRLGFR
jgi:predicted Zn-dependent protease